MAIKTIPRITCSLSLGYIYNVSYGYVPREGVSMTLFFVNESGEYDTNFLSVTQKCTITIGSTVFQMYPLAWRTNFASGQKILQVDFIDETFRLGNYYVVLTDEGCGPNVYQLGAPLRELTPPGMTPSQQKTWEAEKNMREAAYFADQDYSFGGFINLLKKKFTVSVKAGDLSARNAYTGSFADVLNSWCSDLGLTYFFENSTLKIVDATKNDAVFPEIPADAINVSQSESLDGTFSKTSANIFKANGEVYSRTTPIITYLKVSPISSRNDVFYIDREGQRMPVSDLPQDVIAASLLGKSAFFAYVYNNGISKEQLGDNRDYYRYLGLTRVRYNAGSEIPNLTETMELVSQMVDSTNLYIASLDESALDYYYNFFRNIGEIYGRYYISDKVGTNMQYLEQFTWVQEDGVSPAKLEPVMQPTQNVSISPSNVSDYINSVIDQISQNAATLFSNIGGDSGGDSLYALPGTDSDYFKGFLIAGSRMMFEDTQYKEKYSMFDLSVSETATLDSIFGSIANGIDGSRGMQVVASILPEGNGYLMCDILETLTNGLDFLGIAVERLKQQITPTWTTYRNLKGIWQKDIRDYYNKVAMCNSASDGIGENVKNHLFDVMTISSDVPTYVETRYGKKVINTSSVDMSMFLSSRTFARTFPARSLSFSTNYFLETLYTPVSQGLDSMNIEVNDNGVRATYNFSNNYLVIPNNNSLYRALDRSMRESQRRGYKPRV